MTTSNLATDIFEELQTEHKSLVEKAIAERSSLVKNKEKMTDFLREVDIFLRALAQLSGQVEIAEDYEWISDAALRWQYIFSSVLNVPHSAVVLSAPPVLKSPETLKFYTDEEIQKWCEQTAREQSLTRWRNIFMQEKSAWVSLMPSTQEERDRDWRDAEILFASKVLEGDLHLTRQLGSGSYRRLEQQWLEEVKRAKAFFIWDNRLDKLSGPSHHEQDYLDACGQIRAQLTRKDLKVRAQDLEDVKISLTHRYLVDGTPGSTATSASDPVDSNTYRFDPQKADSFNLLVSKAFRLWQTTGRSDSAKNWEDALIYCEAFYGSILPAVQEKDPERKKEHTLRVLQAFERGQAQEHRYQIVNCFEVALAIYFLDTDIVNTLWRDNEIRWETTL